MSEDEALAEAHNSEMAKLGAQMRMALRDYLNAVWAVVDEELADYPEARERVRKRLDLIRINRSRRQRRTI